MNQSNEAIIALLNSLSMDDYAEVCAGMKDIEVPEQVVCRRWRAEKGGEYYHLLSTLEVRTAYDMGVGSTTDRYLSGNYYETSAQAQHARDKRLAEQRIEDALLEHGKGWEADWSSYTQYKYAIVFSYSCNKFIVHHLSHKQAGLIGSKDACNWVIANLSADLKLALQI